MVRGFQGAVVTALAAVALAALPASAGARDALSVYHPDPEARSFATTAGGFTATVERDGLCIPLLLCPLISNGHEASGGVGGDGDGFLRTEVGPLLGVAGETRAIWTSTPFVYNGAEGQNPTDLSLSITRRSDLAALLSVVGNTADYSVELVDENGGFVATRVIDRASLAPTQGWTKTPLVKLDPADVIRGHTYRIQIVSRFIYGAEVLQGGSADYDNLALAALRVEDDVDGNGGGNGGQRPGNNAIFDGRRLFIKLKCFGEQGNNGKCQSRATALKSKKGVRYTFPIQRIVTAKRGKVIRARVRFRFRSELERRNSIILKSVLRENRKDDSREIKFKRLKLIDRSPD